MLKKKTVIDKSNEDNKDKLSEHSKVRFEEMPLRPGRPILAEECELKREESTLKL